MSLLPMVWVWGLLVVEGEVGAGVDHQDVLILDVAMDNAPLLAGEDGVDNLLEKALGHLLFENASLGDEVKEVLAIGRTLHDQDERVGPFVKVHESDDTRNS